MKICLMWVSGRKMRFKTRGNRHTQGGTERISHTHTHIRGNRKDISHTHTPHTDAPPHATARSKAE